MNDNFKLYENFLKVFYAAPRVDSVENLMSIYDFIDECFEISKEVGIENLRAVMDSFLNTVPDKGNCARTICIICGSLKTNPAIKDLFDKLVKLA